MHSLNSLVVPKDIENVLRQHAGQIIGQGSRTIARMALDIHDRWDHQIERVIRAGLQSGTGISEQMEGAYAEIRAILIQEGVLRR